MARSVEQIVKETLGEQAIVIAGLRAQLEALQEKLATLDKNPNKVGQE